MNDEEETMSTAIFRCVFIVVMQNVLPYHNVTRTGKNHTSVPLTNRHHHCPESLIKVMQNLHTFAT